MAPLTNILLLLLASHLLDAVINRTPPRSYLPAPDQTTGITHPFYSSFKGTLKQKRDELIKRFLTPDTMTITRARSKSMVSQFNSEEFAHVKRVHVHFIEDRPTLNHDATLREYLSLLSNDIMDPNHGLFTSTVKRGVTEPPPSIPQFTRFPHRRSHAAILVPQNKETDIVQLRKLTNLGWTLGVAILNKQFLDVSFTPLFYKLLMNRRIDLHDIKPFHPGLTKDLESILYFTESVDDLHLTMSYRGTDDVVRDLLPGGKNMSVTDMNKAQYVDLVIEFYVRETVETAANAVFDGLFHAIDRDAFAMFNENELSILISGDPHVNVGTWHRFAHSPLFITPASRRVLKWFWECVTEWDIDMRSRLLLYVTGTSRLPLAGFKDATIFRPSWFNIEWLPRELDVLPTSDPYKNTLYLPSYSSKDVLKAMIQERLLDQGGVRTWYASATRLRYLPREPKSMPSCWPNLFSRLVGKVPRD